MLFRNNTRAQSQDHNEQVRKVVFRSGFDFGKMFVNRQSCSRSMLITGGCAQHREEILEEAILRTKEKLAVPMVVFTCSEHLERSLIDAFRGSSAYGPLRICSDAYPTYQFFRGLSPNLTGDFFAKAAAMKGFLDGSDLYKFTAAFMSLLGAVDESPSLSSMMELAKASNTRLEQGAVAQGFGSEDDAVFSRGGESFRALLKIFSRSVGSIAGQGDDESGTSLTRLLDEGRDFTLLIRPDKTDDMPLVALYFSIVLKTVMNRPLIIVTDDSFMVSDEFRAQIETCRRVMPVIFSSRNAVLYAGADASTGLDNHYARRILLLEDDGLSPADKQRLLDECGSFSEFIPTETQSDTPHILFSFERSNAQGIMQVTRAKVLLEECVGYGVAASGYSGAEITIAQFLRR